MGSSFREIFQHLSRHKLRTFLTGAAVGWGVLLLVFLLGVGQSFERGMRSSSRQYSATDLRIYAGYTSKPFGGYAEDRIIEFNDLDIELILRASSLIDTVYKVGQIPGSEVKSDIESVGGGFSIMGVHPDMYSNNLGLDILEGRVHKIEDYQNARHLYIVPDRMATKLFPNSTSYIGRRIILNGISGIIIGVYKRESYARDIVYVPFSELQTRESHLQRGVKMLGLDLGGRKLSEAEANQLEQELRTILARHKNFDSTDETAVWLNTWVMSRDEKMDLFFVAIEIFLWMVGLSILSIGVIGVSNIMLVTVSERRKEIGIRKALGARPHHLIGMVLGESVLLTLTAGLVGLLVALVILMGLDYLVTSYGLGSTVVFGERLSLLGKVTISFPTGIATILVMTITGCIAGLKPIRKAMKIPAVEAMRDN